MSAMSLWEVACHPILAMVNLHIKAKVPCFSHPGGSG